MPEREPIADETRFDREATRRIVALATHLQSQDLEHLTAEQLKAIAAEAGIEPRFIEASIAALQQGPAPRRARVSLAPARRAGGWLRQRLEPVLRSPDNLPFLRAGAIGLAAWLIAALPFLPLPTRIMAGIALGVGLFVNDALSGTFRRGLLGHGIGHGLLILLLSLLGPNPGPVQVGGTAGILSILLLPLSLLGGALGGIVYAVSGGRSPALADRHQLLKQFYELHDALISGTGGWTFLAVDVVGSTALKAGADPLAVEYTFREYDRYVAESVAAHGGRVHSTAGDGALCAFPDPQSAFAAARALQQGIPAFNQRHNRLRERLRVRAGLHCGVVVAPEGDPRHTQFSQVLDLASHLQKAAPPGGIALSEDAARQIGAVESLTPLPEPVDGARVYAWTGDPLSLRPPESC